MSSELTETLDRGAPAAASAAAGWPGRAVEVVAAVLDIDTAGVAVLAAAPLVAARSIATVEAVAALDAVPVERSALAAGGDPLAAARAPAMVGATVDASAAGDGVANAAGPDPGVATDGAVASVAEAGVVGDSVVEAGVVEAGVVEAGVAEAGVAEARAAEAGVVSDGVVNDGVDGVDGDGPVAGVVVDRVSVVAPSAPGATAAAAVAMAAADGDDGPSTRPGPAATVVPGESPIEVLIVVSADIDIAPSPESSRNTSSASVDVSAARSADATDAFGVVWIVAIVCAAVLGVGISVEAVPTVEVRAPGGATPVTGARDATVEVPIARSVDATPSLAPMIAASPDGIDAATSVAAVDADVGLAAASVEATARSTLATMPRAVVSTGRERRDLTDAWSSSPASPTSLRAAARSARSFARSCRARIERRCATARPALEPAASAGSGSR
jgi:hypothetical protein